jgi:hypothetical protein
MKRLYCFFALLFLPLAGPQALPPGNNATLFEHLSEINKLWTTLTPDKTLLQPIRFRSDNERIQEHLRQVERRLNATTSENLTNLQLKNRQRHLNQLHQYWQAARFPTNHFHLQRRPYFRDHFGVLCAVGYLLWQDGQYELVNRIQQHDNYDYLADLAERYPEIATWAQANGFTLDELALIQPTYEPPLPNLQSWGAGLNPGGRIHTMTKDDTDSRLFVAGQFSSVDGMPANSIAVWNGSSWSTLGDGVVGTIYAMQYFKIGAEEKLFVGGRFHLPGWPEKQNIAEYNFSTGVWKGLQTGEMDGAVYTLCKPDNPPHLLSVYLFIGGDFKKVNGQNHPYFAEYHPYNGGVWNAYLGSVKTDGPVRSICNVEDGRLLVGGSFTKVFSESANNWIDAPHLAYYQNDDWLLLSHQLPPVTALAYHEGNIFVGNRFKWNGNNYRGIHILKAGIWQANLGIWPPYQQPDTVVSGFANDGVFLLAFGSFWGGSQSFGYGGGMIAYHDDDLTANGVLLPDSSIYAAASFQGQVYVSGNFTRLFDQAFPGMARFTPLYTNTTAPEALSPFKINAAGGELRISGPVENGSAHIAVFDIHGRLLHRQVLSDQETILSTAGWPAGLYCWQIETPQGRWSGKIVSHIR